MPRARDGLLNRPDTDRSRIAFALHGNDIAPIRGYQIDPVVTGRRGDFDMPSGILHARRHEGLEIDAGHLVDLRKPG
ncbi:hypothetical protein MYCSP_22035 [Mycobacteroides saopaulense]|nr:hypothetical protein MYCSP_22035 [Mycobacteroides saopaulense]